MSSHRRNTKYFSRKFNARKALLRGLMISLVEHERIATTVVKAKEVRRHIEKAITLGRRDNLTARRELISTIANEGTVQKIMSDLSPRFASRPGGYTRIIKIGRRPGDTSEMAFIEFVDYDYEKKGAGAPAPTPTAKAAGKGKAKKAADTSAIAAASKEKAKKARQTVKLAAASKKRISDIQKKSRAANRA
jgi:large subunit ribosomal protein L17